MKALFVLIFIVSCSLPVEEEFQAQFIGTNFQVTKYRESSSASNEFRVNGVAVYRLLNDILNISYSNFSESNSVCNGVVLYNYSIKTKAQFDTELNGDTEVAENDSDSYSIFTPYIENSDIEESNTDTDENLLEPQIYYVIATLDNVNLNSLCPIPHQDTLYLYFKLYSSGELDMFNYNRSVFYRLTDI
jgi:hypothetical protein